MANAKRKALLKKLSSAKASGVGNNFKDGKYRLAFKKCMLEETSKGKLQFRAIFTVMSATKIPVQSKATGERLDVEPNRVGGDVDWLAVELDATDSPGPGNIRKLMQEAFNVPDISDDEYLETLHEMCDLDEEGDPLEVPKEPMRGKTIDMETVRIITKKNKIEIVVCNWCHVKQTEEEQAAVGAWLSQVAVVSAQQAAPVATA